MKSVAHKVGGLNRRERWMSSFIEFLDMDRSKAYTSGVFRYSDKVKYGVVTGRWYIICYELFVEVNTFGGPLFISEFEVVEVNSA